MKIEQLFTRKKANAGVEIPVVFPGQTEPVGTIKIIGCDSEVYKEQMRLRAIENARILTLPFDQQQPAIDIADLEAVAGCVKSWSFETEFTKSNVKRLLCESPFIFELVNQSVMNRSLFMG
jgi:hypothetical protein